MNRPASGLLVLALALPAAMGPATLAAADDPNLARARRLLAKHPLIDGHNDLPWAIREYEKAPRDVVAYDLRQHTTGNTDFARLKAGGVGGQFWSVYIPAEEKSIGFAKTQLEQLDIARRVIERYPDRLTLALTASDVERAMKKGRIASLLGMEGGHAIESSLGALRAFHALGARYMTLTHTATLDWADAAGDAPRHGGLTRFGEEVVREMNRLGMLVDLSHVAPETMKRALAVSAAPVIFSHSSARALTDHPRDVPDDVLRLLPANGGVVMVSFVPGFTSEAVRAWNAESDAAQARFKSLHPGDPRRAKGELEAWQRDHPAPRATLAQVADHVEHVRRVAGVDHVGIGSDFDGITSTPLGLEGVDRYPVLLAELLRRGWSDEEVGKLAGENILRVLAQAERTAARLQKERPASDATIEELDGSPAPKPAPKAGG